MSSRSNSEVYVGSRNAELPKENVGHVGVIVLARVYESLFNSAAALQSPDDGGRFHEVWSRANYMQNVHSSRFCYAPDLLTITSSMS
jgi:hypothetical protein